MTQEEKKLLLTDLCARLPYNLCIRTYYKDDVYGDIILHKISDTRVNDLYKIENCKPYLRPMSNMTEEEKEELLSLMKEETKEMIELMRNNNFGVLKGKYHFNCLKELNWLLKNHFDFKGLIPKGLAIAVTEENNPYKG